MTLRLRLLSREEHLAFIRSRPSASFLQCPSWADVKSEWTSDRLGWVDETGRVVGAALVLYRQVPKVKRYLAYLPEGPVIDWADEDLDRWLDPMLSYLKEKGAFMVKMGPPVVTRRWGAATIKEAIAEGSAKRLRDVKPDRVHRDGLLLADKLRAAGWQQQEDGGAGFGDVQPRYVFQVPLAGRTPEQVQKGMNQLWRRNIKKAEKAGVEVVLGGYEDLEDFHRVYVITAERDRFTPRPLSYFQRMWKALSAEEKDRIRLYVAELGDEVLAATLMVRVGEHVWYSYGASSNEKREARPSNAVQWRMIRDSIGMGASVYDLRGISDTLDPDDHLFGLIQFKVGTGGEAVEFVGEWDYPLSKLMSKAFEFYMSRR